MDEQTQPAHAPDTDQTHTDGVALPLEETRAVPALDTPAVRADEPQTGVVWKDNPANITNRFGEWKYGVPRYDLSADDIATLGPGFEPAPATTAPGAKESH